MKKFDDVDELISWLKKQDLKKYGVGLGLNGKRDLDGWEMYPYKISGYLYERETLKFPIHPFQVTKQVFNKDDFRGIQEIRRAISGKNGE